MVDVGIPKYHHKRKEGISKKYAFERECKGIEKY